MASLTTSSSGKRRIMFNDLSGNRQSVYLGKMPKDAAEVVKVRINQLIAIHAAGTDYKTTEVAKWVQGLSDEFHAKLEQAGLVEPREAESIRTVGQLLDQFLATQHVKDSTHKSYKQTLDSLREFLGENTAVRSVTARQARGWRKHIATQTEGVKKKRATADNRLSPATVAKRVNVARVVFNRAVEWKLIEESPFAKITPGSQVNEENEFQVPREWTTPILEACPSSKWRLVYGLARLAGLRVPSELVELTWSDVDWKRGRLTVNGKKTEHHGAGHGLRFVPICPQLMQLLEEHFEQAPKGAVALFPDVTPSTNLGTTMRKIIVRAGLVPWVRLFDNARASCENDWAEELPAHVVEKWMGHTGAVARKHYLRAQEHHFKAVVDGGGVSAPESAQAGDRGAQHNSAENRSRSQDLLEAAIASALMRRDAELCGDTSILPVGDIGLELSRSCRGKSRSVSGRDALESARGGELVAVAWAILPAEVRLRVLELVREAVANEAALPSTAG